LVHITDPNYVFSGNTNTGVSGWTYTRNGIDFHENTPIYDNLTVYARWSKLYTVTFDLNGGTFNGSGANVIKRVYDHEQFVWLDDVTSPNGVYFHAVTWTRVKNDISTEYDYTPVIGNMTLYAYWP